MVGSISNDASDGSPGRRDATSLEALSDFSARLWLVTDPSKVIEEVLGASTKLLGSDTTCVQMFDPVTQTLVIQAHHGIDPEVVEQYRVQSIHANTASATAARTGTRVIVPDLTAESEFASLQGFACVAGFRAVQSTPMMDHHGQCRGVLTTYFQEPDALSAHQLMALDLYVRQASSCLERCRLEAELQQRQQFLDLALDAASAGTWQLDVASGRGVRDLRSCAIFGVDPPGTSTLEAILALVHEADRTSIRTRLQTMYDTPGDDDWNEEFRVLHPEHGIRWIQGIGRALRDRNGKAVSLAGINLDVTDRKLAELGYRESRTVLDAALASMADMVFICDTDGHFIEFNEAFATFHRYSSKQDCWRKLSEWADVIEVSTMDGTVVPLDEWAISQALRGETVTNVERRLRRKDTGEAWIGSYNFAPVRTEKGQIVGVVGVGRDVTETKAMERALRDRRVMLEQRVAERTKELEAVRDEAMRANAAKSRFLAAASHDLRQPLQSAAAYMAVLQRQLETQGQLRAFQNAMRSIDSAADILNALLDITQLENGTIKPQKQDFEIAELLARVVDSNQDGAERKGLCLVIRQGQGVVHSDPALLERIVDNLVSNAIRYTERGEVVIACESHGDGLVRISVTDTGVGIPQSALHSIFDEYVQLDNPARQSVRGLGLGLSIVRLIARLLDHDIHVSSVEGRGSTFAIDLPGSVASLAIENAAARQDQDSGAHVDHPVVMLVDDDPAIVDALEMLLDMSGFAICSAATGEAALALLRDGRWPDVMVTDFRMPDMEGVTLIRQAREIVARPLPVILLTGEVTLTSADLPDLTDCRILHKPVKPDQLVDIMNTIAAAQRSP